MYRKFHLVNGVPDREYCKINREDIYYAGLTAWFFNGELHRENGPAVKFNDQEHYFKRGESLDPVIWGLDEHILHVFSWNDL